VSEEVGVQMRQHLQKIEDRNADTLDLVAARMHQVIVDDGLVLTTGTGHSLAMVLETFYRAGGLACVRPITHPALFPLEGGAVSTLLERVPGFGRLLVEAAQPSDRDMAFVFSNSGTNPVPVEIALALLEAGTTVVAVSSYEHMSRAPARAQAKLGDVADHVLDTAAPYGDAFIPTDDGPAAALSSLAGVYLWNLLLARLARLAAAGGTSLPIWVSANVSGGDDRNRALRTRYGARIPTL
jgi:uncharacterized phosphosugar-binding protein